MNQTEARDALLLIKRVFAAKAIPFWLVFGTLLGAIRDGDFIPWDKDIDLGCYAQDRDRIREAVDELIPLGFVRTRRGLGGDWFQIGFKTVPVDFILASRWGDGKWRYGHLSEPKDYFSHLGTLEFLGDVFAVPDRAVEYLEDHYGNWRTPDPGCKHATMFRVRR